MYTLLFHKPEHIQMLMRPVRPPSKALPTCALLNFSIHLPVSWEFVQEFMTVVQKIMRNSQLKAAGKTCLHLLIRFKEQKYTELNMPYSKQD